MLDLEQNNIYTYEQLEAVKESFSIFQVNKISGAEIFDKTRFKVLGIYRNIQNLCENSSSDGNNLKAHIAIVEKVI